jgi:glycerate kinase
MRILIAPDSFKGSLSAVEAADCMAEGLAEVFPEAELIKVPIADGGEGTVQAMLQAAGGRLVPLRVTGPMGDPVDAFYGVLKGGSTAVIEMAAASGLHLVPPDRLNPLAATTYGTGELILAAVRGGCRKLIIGLGGSATNDGGLGAAQALGVRFRAKDGSPIGFGGAALSRIDDIDTSGLDPLLAGCEIVAACDVTNPMCGPSGASSVFGPQKGASPAMVHTLDQGLLHFSRLIREQTGKDITELPGAGAAGGLGGGLIAFLSATLMPGTDVVFETVGMERLIAQSDIVFTGEGRTDSQTLMGKAPYRVAALARQLGKPVVCLSGGIAQGAQQLYEHGVNVVTGAVQAPMTLQEAVGRSPELVRQAASAVARSIQIGMGITR